VDSPWGCDAGGEQYNVDELTELTRHVELPIHTVNSSASAASFKLRPCNSNAATVICTSRRKKIQATLVDTGKSASEHKVALFSRF